MATVLTELDVEKVRRSCSGRVPAKFADEVRLEVTTRGGSVPIHECRPIWKGAPAQWTKMAIAQIGYQGDGTWNLYFTQPGERLAHYPLAMEHQAVYIRRRLAGDALRGSLTSPSYDMGRWHLVGDTNTWTHCGRRLGVHEKRMSWTETPVKRRCKRCAAAAEDR